MKTRFTGTASTKEEKTQLRIQALSALRDFVNDLPNFSTIPYKEVKADDIHGQAFLEFTILEEDPAVCVRVYPGDRANVHFVYRRQGFGCVLYVTKQEWAQWLVDHLNEVDAN